MTFRLAAPPAAAVCLAACLAFAAPVTPALADTRSILLAACEGHPDMFTLHCGCVADEMMSELTPDQWVLFLEATINEDGLLRRLDTGDDRSAYEEVDAFLDVDMPARCNTN